MAGRRTTASVMPRSIAAGPADHGALLEGGLVYPEVSLLQPGGGLP